MPDYCKNCGAKINENTKFCPDCGTKIENRIPELSNDIDYCPNCGKKVEHKEGFCQNCGTNLVSQQPIQKANFFEKNKVPLIILAAVVIICIVVIGGLSLITTPVDVGTQTVSVGSHEYEIPGNYKVDPSTIDVDYNGYSAIFSQSYTDGEELISIAAMTVPYNVDANAVAASQGGVQKNLMGVNGYYTEDNGVYTFAFVDGTFLHVVSVSSPDLFDKMRYLG